MCGSFPGSRDSSTASLGPRRKLGPSKTLLWPGKGPLKTVYIRAKEQEKLHKGGRDIGAHKQCHQATALEVLTNAVLRHKQKLTQGTAVRRAAT
jgi:hypothetical protein